MKKNQMSNFSMITIVVITLFTICVFTQSVKAQTTEFTYQGQLENAAAPANGSYDFQFALFDSLKVRTDSEQSNSALRRICRHREIMTATAKRMSQFIETELGICSAQPPDFLAFSLAHQPINQCRMLLCLK
ncbi:hypothetical protein BH20ACI1_BH20ACI1_02450 [soil metagenome]